MLFFVSTIYVMDKKKLRQKYKDKRKSIKDDINASYSLAIANQLLALPLWEHSNFHLFLSSTLLGEVDTEYVLTILQGKDKQVVVPRMQTEHELKHILLTDSTLIKPNRWGIPEPQEGIELLPRTTGCCFLFHCLLLMKRGIVSVMGKAIMIVFWRPVNRVVLKLVYPFFRLKKAFQKRQQMLALIIALRPIECMNLLNQKSFC